MDQNKRSGVTTMWALLLLPVIVGGAGLTAWKLRAEAPSQTTVQQLQEELDKAQKAEAEVKKQLEEEQEARQALERERNEALAMEKETRKSTEDAQIVLAFLQDNVLLAPGRPSSWSREGLGKDVTLRKAVDLAASKVAGAYPDRPMVEATIREMLGASYIDLGEAKEAVEQYKRAYALRTKVLGSDDRATCDCRNKLAIAYRDAGLTDAGSRLYEINPNDKAQEAMQSRKPGSAPQGASPGAAPRNSKQKGQGS